MSNPHIEKRRVVLKDSYGRVIKIESESKYTSSFVPKNNKPIKKKEVINRALGAMKFGD